MEIVVCIDIGTLYSGYAYSSRKEFQEDMLRVHLNEEWMSGHANLHTFKTPSIALLQPDKMLNSFGYEAERKFAQLFEIKQHNQWFFFKRFRTDLKTQQFRKDTVLAEEGGKSVNGITLYSMIIKFLKSHFLESVSEGARYGSADVIAKNYSIRYVILVPTKWDNASRECMKTAAKKAGISSCVIHSESEAAGTYCRLLPLQTASQGAFYVQQPRTRHVIVNIGGIIDTSIQEVSEDGSINEFAKNFGSSSGSIRVDADFVKFLTSLFGNDFIESYSKKHKLDFLELQYEFEVRKRLFSLESDMAVKLELPQSLVKSYTTKSKQSIQFLIDDSDFVGRILSQDEYLILDKTVVKDIFGTAIKSTVGYLTTMSRDPEVKECAAIIIVGGFAESPVVKGAIKYYLPNEDVIIPERAELVSLMGGVVLGLNQGNVLSLSPKYSVGIGIAEPFDEKIHIKEKKFLSRGKAFCSDVFQCHIPMGRKVIIGQYCKARSLTLNRAGQRKLAIPLYMSTNPKTGYTTDQGCRRIEKMHIDIKGVVREKTKISVQMVLLGNSVIVVCTDDADIILKEASFELNRSEVKSH